jgi:putative holliday junction resolvase
MSAKPDLVLPPDAFAAAVPLAIPLFGLDLGTKTIGIAIADPSWTVATALHTIRRTKFTADVEALLELVNERGIGGLVIGLPLHLDGGEGPRAQATRAFVRSLAALTPLPMMLWDERLSTVAAERALLASDTSRKKRAAIIDQTAAAFILQGALDRMRRLRQPLALDHEL